MILSGKLNFDKSLPPYILKFNIATAILAAVSVIVFVPALIAYVIIYNKGGGEFTTVLILLIPFAIFVTGLIILYTVALNLRKRFLNEYCARVESQFADMLLEEAKASLMKRGIITDGGFIFSGDNLSGEKVVAFDKVECYLWTQPFEENSVSAFKRRLLPEISVTLELYSDDDGCEREMILPLDRELFNFLAKESKQFYDLDQMLGYLINDKMNFCRQAFGFRTKK